MAVAKAEAPKRKVGRPPGPRRTHTTQDLHENILQRALSPHRPPNSAHSLASQGDQHQEDSDQAYEVSSPTTAILRDNSQSPHLSDSDGQLPFSLVAEEQLDITNYARQQLTQLGAKFKPVSCKQQSGTQACFCFPHWGAFGSGSPDILWGLVASPTCRHR